MGLSDKERELMIEHRKHLREIAKIFSDKEKMDKYLNLLKPQKCESCNGLDLFIAKCNHWWTVSGGDQPSEIHIRWSCKNCEERTTTKNLL